MNKTELVAAMPFENLSSPLYPFEEISECNISDAYVCRKKKVKSN